MKPAAPADVASRDRLPYTRYNRRWLSYPAVRFELMFRRLGFALSLVAVAATGCSVQQQSVSAPSAAPVVHPLPIKGRLIDGDPAELPPAVAASLARDTPVTFSYREELTHDEYHVPLLVTALDPVTYVGAPLGDYGVTAFASLSIVAGDRILGDYTAKAHVSKSYTLYSQPTHQELEREAREAVREKIDQKLYQDSARLAQAAATHAAPAPPSQ